MIESAQNNRDYKGLIVYQKAKANALRLLQCFRTQKPSWSDKFIIVQLLRALTSIGANITEGYGRRSKNDYRRFLIIAKASALESEYWIDILSEIKPELNKTLQEVRNSNIEVIKMLTILIKNQIILSPEP